MHAWLSAAIGAGRGTTQRDESAQPISVTRDLIEPFFVNNGQRIARNAEIDTFNQGECRDATASETDQISSNSSSDRQMGTAHAQLPITPDPDTSTPLKSDHISLVHHYLPKLEHAFIKSDCVCVQLVEEITVVCHHFRQFV